MRTRRNFPSRHNFMAFTAFHGVYSLSRQEGVLAIEPAGGMRWITRSKYDHDVYGTAHMIDYRVLYVGETEAILFTQHHNTAHGRLSSLWRSEDREDNMNFVKLELRPRSWPDEDEIVLEHHSMYEKTCRDIQELSHFSMPSIRSDRYALKQIFDIKMKEKNCQFEDRTYGLPKINPLQPE